MVKSKPRTKPEIVAQILTNETYLPGSPMYQRVAAALGRLPLRDVQDLSLILTFKVIESNYLDRRVQKILND